jgi:hypothetical protein
MSLIDPKRPVTFLASGPSGQSGMLADTTTLRLGVGYELDENDEPTRASAP